MPRLQTGISVFDGAPVTVSPRPARSFLDAPLLTRLNPLEATIRKQIDLQPTAPPLSPEEARQIMVADKTGQQKPLRTHRTNVAPSSPRRPPTMDENDVLRTRSLRSSLAARTSTASTTKSMRNNVAGRFQTETLSSDVPKLDFTAVRPYSKQISRSARESAIPESPNRIGTSSARWQKLDHAWGAPARERAGRTVPVHCASTITTSPSTLEFRFDSMYSTGRRDGWAIRKDRTTGRWQGTKDIETENGKYGQWNGGTEVTRPFTAGIRHNAWNHHWQTARDWATARTWQETRGEGALRPSRTR